MNGQIKYPRLALTFCSEVTFIVIHLISKKVTYMCATLVFVLLGEMLFVL